jgi:transketolase
MRCRAPSARGGVRGRRHDWPEMATADAGETDRGGWVAAGFGACELVLVAEGESLGRAMTARAWLAREADVSVVAMPVPADFERQDPSYRDEVLPPGVPRVPVRAELDAVERAIAEGRAAIAAHRQRRRR